MPRERWHVRVTPERIMYFVDRRRSTLDDPGICLACGADQGGCEPDARRHKCESCGRHQVYGVEDLLVEVMP